MRFYDRKRELERLNSIREVAFRDHSQLVALTGRRRIGKTSLILKSCEHQPLPVIASFKIAGIVTKIKRMFVSLPVDPFIR